VVLAAVVGTGGTSTDDAASAAVPLQLALPQMRTSFRGGAAAAAAHAAEMNALEPIHFDSALAYHLMHVHRSKLVQRPTADALPQSGGGAAQGPKQSKKKETKEGKGEEVRESKTF
jgi:hypothetical protein